MTLRRALATRRSLASFSRFARRGTSENSARALFRPIFHSTLGKQCPTRCVSCINITSRDQSKLSTGAGARTAINLRSAYEQRINSAMYTYSCLSLSLSCPMFSLPPSLPPYRSGINGAVDTLGNFAQRQFERSRSQNKMFKLRVQSSGLGISTDTRASDRSYACVLTRDFTRRKKTAYIAYNTAEALRKAPEFHLYLISTRIFFHTRKGGILLMKRNDRTFFPSQSLTEISGRRYHVLPTNIIYVYLYIRFQVWISPRFG